MNVLTAIYVRIREGVSPSARLADVWKNGVYWAWNAGDHLLIYSKYSETPDDCELLAEYPAGVVECVYRALDQPDQV